MLITNEEATQIIRQHNVARISISRTEQALIDRCEVKCQARIEQVRAEERKALGEWLTRKVYSDSLLIPHWIVEALKSGTMPDKEHQDGRPLRQ